MKDEPTLLAVLAILLAIAALWAVGCGGGGGGAYSTPTTPSTPTASTPAASTGANVTVSILGSAGSGAFSPNPASASAGQTLAFKNNDGTTHHLVADNGTTWDSGDIPPGATSKTLSVSSGTAISFHCTIHPTMVGSINGASAPPPPTMDPSGGYHYEY